MSKTPRTIIATYNGFEHLIRQCATLELENEKMRDALELLLSGYKALGGDMNNNAARIAREALEEVIADI